MASTIRMKLKYIHTVMCLKDGYANLSIRSYNMALAGERLCGEYAPNMSKRIVAECREMLLLLENDE